MDTSVEEENNVKKPLLNLGNTPNSSNNGGGSDLENTDEKLKKSGPSTPLARVGYLLASPVRFMQRKFKAGGIKGSIFSLITAILGSGTITLPYLAAKNGIVLAMVLIIFGAIISYFAGMLLVSCAEKVGSDKYEDFAQH